MNKKKVDASGRVSTRYDEATKKRCYVEYLKGKTPTEIAKEVGVNRNTLFVWITREKWVDKKEQVKELERTMGDKDALDNVLDNGGGLINFIALQAMVSLAEKKVKEALDDKDIKPKNWRDVLDTMKFLAGEAREEGIPIEISKEIVKNKTGKQEVTLEEGSTKAKITLREMMRGVSHERRRDIYRTLRRTIDGVEGTDGAGISPGVDRDEFSPGERGTLSLPGPSVSEGNIRDGSLPGNGDREKHPNGGNDLWDF